jgi:hypothetical protein
MPDQTGPDTRDGFLSVARTALFFLDLLDVQRLLGSHRLITPDVEAQLSAWVAEHESSLGTLAGDVRAIMDDPARVEARRDAIEKMLAQFVDRLPCGEPGGGRSRLQHAS